MKAREAAALRKEEKHDRLVLQRACEARGVRMGPPLWDFRQDGYSEPEVLVNEAAAAVSFGEHLHQMCFE